MTTASGRCHRRADCRLCGSTRVSQVLSLEPTPPANAFVPAAMLEQPQQCFPLDIFFCQDCSHVQMLDVVDPCELFENYVYVSGTSPVFVKHFENYAADIRASFAPPARSLVVDIGSNDGTLLGFFGAAGHRVLGIDPARDIARIATEAGIETLCGFFTRDLADTIRAGYGPAAVVTANNVFAHVDDLGDVARGVRDLLAPEGVFVFEVSYLVDVFENTLFDTIYHEHLAYHSVKPLIGFLARNGLELIEAFRVGSHGGSLRAVAQLQGGPRPVGGSVGAALAEEARLGLDKAETFHAFAHHIDALKAELAILLKRLKADGRRFAGFGAPAKATTLMYHFGLGADVIDYIVDDSPLKQGLYTPGLHIPVVSSSAIAERAPDYLLILAWNFAPSIIARHTTFRQGGGHFILPLPRVEVV